MNMEGFEVLPPESGRHPMERIRAQKNKKPNSC
jgi:hypothetical protein